MADVVMSAAGFLLACAGIAAALEKQPALAWVLLMAGGMTSAAAALAIRFWPSFALNIVLVVLLAWLGRRYRRRRKRAPRAYGAKSRARITALVTRAREAARPRPVRRPAPQGG